MLLESPAGGRPHPLISSVFLNASPERSQDFNSVLNARSYTARPCRRLDKEGSVSAHYIENFFGRETATALFSEPSGARRCRSVPAVVPLRDFWRLCQKNITISDDEGHGCTARPLPKSTWQMIFSAVNQLNTLGAGLRQFTELVPAIRAGIAASIGYGRNGIHLNYLAAEEPRDQERFERYLEVIAMAFHCAMLWVTDRPIQPVQIRLSALLNDRDGSPLAGLAPITMRAGEGVTIVYDREDMALPLGARKYQYWSNETSAFEQWCNDRRQPEPGGDLQVVNRVRALIATRALTLYEIAPELGMSMATLQRRLREAGVSYRILSKDVRCEKLVALLATDIDLDDVAEVLGFSERRSLRRTCQEWLGVSPSEYRRRWRDQPSGMRA